MSHNYNTANNLIRTSSSSGFIMRESMQDSDELQKLRARLIGMEDDITELKLELAETRAMNDVLTKELDDAKEEIQRLRRQAYSTDKNRENNPKQDRRGSVTSISSGSCRFTSGTSVEASSSVTKMRPSDRVSSTHRRHSISACRPDPSHREQDDSPPTFSHAIISNGLRTSLSSLAAEVLPTNTSAVAPPASSNRIERSRGSISNDSLYRCRSNVDADDGSVNSTQSVVSLEKRYAELQRRFNHTSSAPLARQGCDQGGQTSNITNQRDRQETSSDSVRSVSQRMLRRLSSAGTSSSASHRY